MSAPLPSGTVTFLFTDIEGSTKRWEQQPQAMSAALARHDAILRQAIEANGGHVFKTVGDAFCAAFATPANALAAALAAQRALQTEDWDSLFRIPHSAFRIRSALHTGVAEERDGDYFGQPLNRVARLMSAGYGGQVLLSLACQELVRDALPQGADLRDLGEYRLKDLFRPERVFQLVTPDLPADFPPLNTLDARPNNLPVQATPFIGREKEVEAICALLRRPEARQLTLTGPGGTGKTRVALQAAAEMVDELEGGVFFIALAPITDPGLVAPTIARTLGVKEVAGRPLLETLKGYLKDRQMLLVLDNFEQVVEGASIVAELMSAAPRLKVLVTSRAVLHIYGEREFPVPPLALPPVGAQWSGAQSRAPLPPLEHLTQYEAVRLFIERAQAAKPDFAVTNDNAPAVAEICHRLDGLPLAIELAAARIKFLPPQAMLAKLQSRLKLLTGGARDRPARQQTLRSTIEWSYDLLDEGEKKLFRRLSVFMSGCTLEASETVCNVEGDLGIDVLEGLIALVDKSVLKQEEANGEPRFWMLETVREYALERLEQSGEGEGLRRRHAEYFLALAERAEPELGQPDQAIWYSRLEEEHDNLRAALMWATDHDVEIALRLCGTLWLFWTVRGHYREAGWRFESVLAQSETARAELMPAWAKALYGAGYLTMGQGDLLKASSYYQACLAAYRNLGDKAGTASTLKELGSIAGCQGNFPMAYSLLEEGLALARETGDKWLVSRCLNDWAEVLRYEGRYDEARLIYEECLLIRRELGNKHSIANALHNLGFVAHRQGDYQRAHALFKEGLLISREVGRLEIIAGCLAGLGGVAWASEQPIKAARLLAAAEALHEALDDYIWPSDQVELDRFLEGTREMLDDTTWQAAWEEGQAMTMEQAIEYALETIE